MTLCRCCNHELDAQEQPALIPGGTPSTLITCWHSFCALCSFTFRLDDYAELDLSTYCPDAQGEAIEQMQARVASLIERMQCFGIDGAQTPQNGGDAR